MRRPIQRQLLWPMLQVVILGSAATALLAAWISVRSARRAEELRLHQLASTLTDAGFPLTNAVLKRMADLSDAQFVTLDDEGTIQSSGVPLAHSDHGSLSQLPIQSTFQAGGDRLVQLEAGSFRAIRIPVRTAGTTRGVSLVILTSQQRWNDLAWRAALPPLIAGLLAAGGAAIWAWALSRHFVTRIHEMVLRAEALAEGQFQSDPLPPVDDELRDLAVALNTTAEKLAQYESQIRVGERLKTLGQLGAGLAHQLRNGITGARMALDLHAVDLPAEVDRESLIVAGRQLALMESYLQRFLTIGRGDPPVMREVELSALVTETLPLVEPHCRHHGIAVTWQPPADVIWLDGDAESLRQMLLNLLMNAIEAVQPLPADERRIGVELAAIDIARLSSGPLAPAPGERGRVRGTIDHTHEFKGLAIRLRIWDQGPGPAENVAATLFDRFVTNKPDGTGLGLAVAREIAQAHGGTIRWFRDSGRTVFDVMLRESG